jgi:hypothetical protein
MAHACRTGPPATERQIHESRAKLKEVNAMATATRKGGGKSSAKRGSGTSARRGGAAKTAGRSGGGSAGGRSQSARGGNRANAGRATAKGRTTGRVAARSTGGRSDQSRKTARGAARASGRSGDGGGSAGRSSKSAGGSRARSGGGGGSRSSQATIDHEQIRQWAEERGGQPSCVRGTGGGDDVGMLRIDFPGYSGADSLQPISWDEFFEKFDERGLALVYQDTTRGQKSNFNKLVSRDDPKVRKQLGGATAGRK